MMQSPTISREALFDADLEQALSLLDREQAKLSTPFRHSSARKSTSYSKLVESPCIYKSHSMDSGLSSISLSSRMSSAQETSSHLSFNVQIPVKHTSAAGSQTGTYYPKYQVYKESKCISCKDCSIFFSPSAFLKHCHDHKLGTRIECNAINIELATDNPGVQQQKLWDEFQIQINGMGVQSHGERDRILTSNIPFKNSVKTIPDNRFSWRENGSGDSLNGSIHSDVLASKRLLQSTQNLIQGSAEKAKRRFNSRKDIMTSVSDLSNGMLDIDGAKQPVIKMYSTSSGQPPSARKSLQKYLSNEKDYKLGILKLSDSSLPSDNKLLDNTRDTRHFDLRSSTNRTDSLVTSNTIQHEGLLDYTAEECSFIDNHIEKHIDNHKQNDKEDPVKILQNAQELLQLASEKIQKQQSQSVINWEERYEDEKKLRRKVEQKLNAVQDQLHLEQQRRQELEIELRALKLQL
ncbi:uncharacterized protein [Antedon mediterranea]|uniref:uncharacterized protein n=1 Tax=Antedon mediterranea TaxID=105859 RepID=UPI003AF45B24